MKHAIANAIRDLVNAPASAYGAQHDNDVIVGALLWGFALLVILKGLSQL